MKTVMEENLELEMEENERIVVHRRKLLENEIWLMEYELQVPSPHHIMAALEFTGQSGPLKGLMFYGTAAAKCVRMVGKR